MGKSMLVEAVQKQSKMLVDELKKQSGQPAPIPHALNVAVINIIWKMTAGEFYIDTHAVLGINSIFPFLPKYLYMS